MLCLADRVETLQGDPRMHVSNQESRKKVVSYGNRLFCDAIGGQLRHRWGSAKLYRAYYQDYRTFLSRPEIAAESISEEKGKHVYVVHSDLRQFYDRVHPNQLSAAINRIRREEDDSDFFSLATSVLDWAWDARDKTNVRIYTEQAELNDFTRVALPQGLVASGFFANVMLLSFDEALRGAIGTDILPGILLTDACRYVDDLRVLITINPNSDNYSSNDLETIISRWLNQVLEENAAGLTLSTEKTKVAALGGDDRPLVRQGAKMNRIQSAVSGGFDAIGGEEILDAIQGLMRVQEGLSVGDESGWRLSPVPDVRDETVARFGAYRYRTTFRSIRPLVSDESELGSDNILPGSRFSVSRNKRELDEDAKAFALGLIQRWIDDPSNVRLLRVGLDLWPDVELLREVLYLFRPFAEKGGGRKDPRTKRVAWYCLAEVLRAGATETGLVPDTESLPSEIDLELYRKELLIEAARLVGLPARTIPWYLRQQALLFLSVYNPSRAPVKRAGRLPETRHYRELIRFLRGEVEPRRGSDFATLAVLARRGFLDQVRAVELILPRLTPLRKQTLGERDLSFLLELMHAEPQKLLFDDLPARLREDLCRADPPLSEGFITLADAVLRDHPTGPLRNELSLLRFAKVFLEQWQEQEAPSEVITPIQVQLKLNEEFGAADVKDLRILESRADPSGSLYEPPAWCKAGKRWRFQLGYLLRFILSGQPDFTRPVRRASWKESESAYRPAESHWYQRLYGLYSGQPAFGDDWVPITDWMEAFILALLRWPGCRAPSGFDRVEQGIEEARTEIGKRIVSLEKRCGSATSQLILPMIAKRPISKKTQRPLRACVVQTVVPEVDDFRNTDLALNAPEIREKHRNHLSAALAAVERMLALRATHKGNERRLDWLILPELAVHPRDVRTHLVPFARAHKAIILTGLTYEPILPGQPLVNSALWVIPEWSEAYGLQIRTRRQGKAHLASNEKKFNDGGIQVLQGFRPCQWLIGYPWSNVDKDKPVWLTAAVCYDATDLGLAADLRDESDILAIPALNKDVKTFDQMALALHYHMFQLVVIANNGQYGGSNAYWPRRDAFIRQVFHIHGQPQASIAFFEIDDISAFLSRKNASGSNGDGWKHLPAGMDRNSP